MQLGLIIYGRLDRLTGGSLYDRLLVERLRSHGHQLEVISLPGQYRLAGLVDNVLPRLRRCLKSKRYDLLLQDALCHPSLVFQNAHLKRLLGCPLVGIVHQVRSRQPAPGGFFHLVGWMERRYLQSLDAVIFTSDTTRCNAFDLAGISPEHITAPPGGDRLGWLTSQEALVSRCRRNGPLRLLAVANVTSNKGLLPLIRALSRLSSKTWRLQIVGNLDMDPANVRSLERFIFRQTLQRRVHLTGTLDGKPLADVYRRSQLFVLPYSCEGFGMAYLEAMAWGLPVIGSTEGGVGEFVRHGHNGFLVAPGALGACATHVDTMNRRRDTLLQASRQALQTFHDRPKWDETLDAVESFLLGLAAGRRRR
jgi:glycosyltransferase involved in cell wall biosynthesis